MRERKELGGFGGGGGGGGGALQVVHSLYEHVSSLVQKLSCKTKALIC